MEKTLPNQQIEDDTTRATAHLPGLDIEIIHRGSPGAEAEQISINLQAVPSFEAVTLDHETSLGDSADGSNLRAKWLSQSLISWDLI